MTSPTSAPQSIRRRAGVPVALALCAGALLIGSGSAAGAPTQGRAPASIGPGVHQDHASPAALGDALRCARPAHRVHFKQDRAVVAVAVGMAESYCQKKATGHNPPTSGCPDGSDDRGLWQINSCYHSEVSDRCAYKAKCNARAAKHISDHGKDWSPWSAYGSGIYKQYLDVAKQAVHRVWHRHALEGRPIRG